MLSAEIALAGRAGGERIRARIVGGFAEPGLVRLEAPAPFGRPVFTLVMRGEAATLLLNRENRVLRDAPPAQLLEALTGVPLGADDLRRAIAGCGFELGEIASAQSLPREWVRIEGAAARSWLRRADGAWRLVASARGPVEIRYDDFVSGRPAAVRLHATRQVAEAVTDLTLRLSQVDINVPLGDDVFEIEIPASALPLSLDELRRNGPLGGSAAGSADATRR